MDITITIDENLVTILNNLAKEKNITPEDLILEQVNNYLKCENKNYLINLINSGNIDDLASITLQAETMKATASTVQE
jgi:hypothetical protein